jgi:hypothetical protein
MVGATPFAPVASAATVTLVAAEDDGFYEHNGVSLMSTQCRQLPRVTLRWGRSVKVAFTTWAYALAFMTAGRLGVTTYLVPPIAIMGWGFLGEAPALLAYVGVALCLAGVGRSRPQPSRT